MKKFTLVLFFSIAFYCGKAQENFLGLSRKVIEAYLVGEDVKFSDGYNETNYTMILTTTDENNNLSKMFFYIDKESERCFFLNFLPSDYKNRIKRINNKYGIPINGYWIAATDFGRKVKVTFDKSNNSFTYSFL